MDESMEHAQKGLKKIARALAAYAEACGGCAMNVYARPGDKFTYISGFAIEGDELLFSFMEMDDKEGNDA